MGILPAAQAEQHQPDVLAVALADAVVDTPADAHASASIATR
jgi:hypothetical protein